MNLETLLKARKPRLLEAPKMRSSVSIGRLWPQDLVRACAMGILALGTSSCGGGGGGDGGGGAPPPPPPPPTAEAPSITAQPASQTVDVGEPVTFTVSATGTAPLTYQWRRNGANLLGATSSSLSIGSTGLGDAGSYDVVVTNTVASVTSASASLALSPIGPSISVQPVSQTVVVGNSVTFAVAATGTDPIAYQWRKDGADIAGAVDSNLIINLTNLGDAGDYDVVVANAVGSVTSASASLAFATTSELVIEAWNPEGTVATIDDFVSITYYETSRWSMYSNYGVFPLGKAPDTEQIASDISSVNVNGTDYVAFNVPVQVRFYFTALWKAPVIGTVFMRADNEGAGYQVESGQPQVLELPYDFARSEFHKAETLLPTGPLSPEAEALLTQANAAMDAAENAATAAERAVAAYTALSFIMPLKERLVLDSSNAIISTTGFRADFDLNYEGFGSWADDTFLAGYTAAKDAGFKSLLANVEWNQVSPTRGTYDFSVLDHWIDRAEELGFNVALMINRTPNHPTSAPWMRELNFDELKTLFYDNASMIVSRYGSRISLYYVSTELELDRGALTLKQLGELAQQSLNGARAASPSTPFGYYVAASAYVPYQMNIVVDASYYSGRDLIEYFSENGIDHEFLGLQMQYGTVIAPIDLQRFQEIIQDVYDASQIPIYMGETGYSSKTEDYGIPAPYFWHDGHTQQAQFEWADGTLRTLYALPFVKGYYWVHVDPDDFDYDDIFLSSLIGTGLVRADGEIKRAQTAFRDFTMQVESFVPGNSNTPASITVTGGAKQSAQVNTTFASTLQIVVRDFFGNPVPNVEVTFVAPITGASGLFQRSNHRVTTRTDNSGSARSPTLSANGSVGPYTVTVSAAGVAAPAVFTLANK